jgi:hypothetical protein
MPAKASCDSPLPEGDETTVQTGSQLRLPASTAVSCLRFGERKSQSQERFQCEAL